MAYSSNASLTDSDSEYTSIHPDYLEAPNAVLSFDPLPEETSICSVRSHGDASIESKSSILFSQSDATLLLIDGIGEAEALGLDHLASLLRGQKYLLDNDYDRASHYLEDSLNFYLENDTDLDLSPYIYTLLIDSYYEGGTLHRAVSVAKEWIIRYPACVTAHGSLARVLFDQLQYDDCILACTVAVNTLKESQGMMSIYTLRGHCYRKKNMFQHSVDDYTRVKALSKKQDLARFSVVEPPFLISAIPVPTPYPTSSSEKFENVRKLVALVKASKGCESPDCPLEASPRRRGDVRHFGGGRGSSGSVGGRGGMASRGSVVPQRLMTVNIGHVL